MYDPYMYDDERIKFPRVGEIVLYTVNKGDNVYRIAKTLNSNVSWIGVMNELNDEYHIRPGQQLFVPVLFKRPPMPPMPPHQRTSYDLYF